MASIIFRSEESRDIMLQDFDHCLKAVPEAETQIVETRFGPTHVLTTGAREAPPLVVLGGAMSNSARALRDIHWMAGHFRMYVVDVVGQSAKSADRRLNLTNSDTADWLVDVIDRLDLNMTNLLGVSWGGFLSRKFCEKYPDRIRKLVLVVPAGIVSGKPLDGILRAALPLMLFRVFGSEAGLRKFVNGQMSNHDPDWLEYFRLALTHYNLDIRTPPLATPDTLYGYRNPVLVIAAEDDVNFPGPELLDRAKELFPQAQVELLPNSRHMPATDAASMQALCDRISGFLLEQARVGTP